MLNSEEFEQLCLSLNWSRDACELAQKIRTSEPVRLVRGRRGNVRGRYPSRKMGVTIQFESHTCELAEILTLEHIEEDVLEFWDQPLTVKLEYKNKNGTNIYPTYTPDFFVIRKTGGEFIECKTEEELDKLSKENHGKYKFGKDGKWHFPPAEKYFEQFGFRHVIVSTAELDRTYIRNISFLADYLTNDTPQVADELRQKIIASVESDCGITLSDLLDRALETGATADDVNTLIATGEIYVDLSAESLTERNRVFVYLNHELAPRDSPSKSPTMLPKGKFVDVKEGSRVLFDDQVLHIVLVSGNKIYMEGEKGSAPCLSLSSFEKLVSKGEIKGLSSDEETDPDNRWKEIVNNGTEKAKAKANRIQKIMLCLLNGEPLPEKVAPRTLARYKSGWLTGERLYGNGLAGVMPKFHLRGDRKTERLDPKARDIMMVLIENDYESNVQKGMFVVWGKAVLQCGQQAPPIKPPNFKTFIRYVRKRPKYLQTLKRMGHRAAYSKEPFHYWLKKDTPPHGDRPFEICHIDHTELDIELVDTKTGDNLGRPWATFMVDAYSRRILAVYLTYDPPSYRSCMMLIRACVRLHSRLPQTIVVDGGSDFKSIYFETLAAAFEITLKTRPGDKPRFGSVNERLFDTTNDEFIHNLKGNTQLTRNVRQLTRSHNPRNLAVWNLGDLYEHLCEWAYNSYETQKHWTLKQAPRDVYASAIRLTGIRRHRLIAYDEEFKILTMPATRKGTAKVIDAKIKINSKWYWCEELDKPEIEGQQIPVRYDPFNVGRAFVYVGNKWVECISDRHLELQGRTEKEQELMSAEERARNLKFSRELPARGVERALQNIEDEKKEKELAEKLNLLRKKARENDTVLSAINGNSPSQGESSRLEDSKTKERKADPQTTAQKRSLFDNVDVSNLGKREEYKG